MMPEMISTGLQISPNELHGALRNASQAKIKAKTLFGVSRWGHFKVLAKLCVPMKEPSGFAGT